MTPQKAVQSPGSNLMREALAGILEKPLVLALFLFFTLVQTAALTALFLSHSGPFNTILGPIIRRFWGDRFLHYPDNFLLLPKLFSHAETVLQVLLGLIVSGIIIQLVASGRPGSSSVTVIEALTQSVKKYFAMALVWVAFYFFLRFTVRSVVAYVPPFLPLHFATLLGLFLVVQSFAVFLFPAILLSGKKFFAALKEGFVLSFKNFPVLIKLLFIPIALSVGMSFLKSMSPMLFRDNPDWVLVVLYAGVFVSSAVDLFITSATAILYMKVRNS